MFHFSITLSTHSKFKHTLIYIIYFKRKHKKHKDQCFVLISLDGDRCKKLIHVHTSCYFFTWGEKDLINPNPIISVSFFSFDFAPVQTFCKTKTMKVSTNKGISLRTIMFLLYSLPNIIVLLSSRINNAWKEIKEWHRFPSKKSETNSNQSFSSCTPPLSAVVYIY